MELQNLFQNLNIKVVTHALAIVNDLDMRSMAKYDVTINRDLCISCACASGRCPTHARTLSRLLNKHSSNGTIDDTYLERALQAAKLCPQGAIKIERVS